MTYSVLRRGMLAIPCLTLLLTGCTYPTQTIEQGTASGHLSFTGAPAGTRIAVDGNDVGAAEYFDGAKHVLDVTPGTHRVVARTGGQVIYDNQVYVGSDSKLSIRVQ
jgi:hypothetical protein